MAVAWSGFVLPGPEPVWSDRALTLAELVIVGPAVACLSGPNQAEPYFWSGHAWSILGSGLDTPGRGL